MLLDITTVCIRLPLIYMRLSGRFATDAWVSLLWQQRRMGPV